MAWMIASCDNQMGDIYPTIISTSMK